MRRRQSSLIAALLVALLSGMSGQALVVSPPADFSQPLTVQDGGRTLLVEEITATWCPSCAEIDPELLRVADSHGCAHCAGGPPSVGR